MSHLTVEQRYQIEALKKIGFGNKKIASELQVHPTTIGRELNRNSDKRNKVYKAELANRKCQERHISKPKKISLTPEVKFIIDYWTDKDYSPEQIVSTFNQYGIKGVCIETIYRYIWQDKNNGGNLYTHLRNQGNRYAKRGNTYNKRGQLTNRKDISERPAEVEKRERSGDLEIDLIIGKDHKGALLTINDRASGKLRMKLLPNKEASTVEAAVLYLLKDCKSELKTITSDNGKEFANHENIARALGIAYYFAKPYHSWERGSNENLNGLIRQYFPIGTSFENITEEKVSWVVERLNTRPRKRYGFRNPNEVHQELLKKVA